MRADPRFGRDDRDECEGMSRRPFELCYKLVLLCTCSGLCSHSELEGSDEIQLHPPPGFVDDGTCEWVYYQAPDVSEPDFPELRLTRKEHKVWEFLIGRMRHLRDVMHILAGITKQLRNAFAAHARFNGTKGDGEIEFTRLWLWAGLLECLLACTWPLLPLLPLPPPPPPLPPLPPPYC